MNEHVPKFARNTVFVWICVLALNLSLVQVVVSRSALPIISSFLPAGGVPGTSVIILGANLGAVTEVQFGGANAVFAVISSTALVATVPLDALTGPISVSGSTGFTATFSQFIAGPRINGFSPINASPGMVVVIEGANFSGTTSVSFANTSATDFTVTAETQIHALVPSAAKSGPISVTTPIGTAFSVNDLVVTGAEPVIDHFFPTNGVPGSIVTITGRNFLGATSVKFKETDATSFSVTAPTQISAVVPAGAGSGPIVVSSPGGTGASALPFVVAGAPLIVSFQPAGGPPGTLVVMDGFAFEDATGVLFNGVRADSFSVIAPTQIHAVVPDNATAGPIRVIAPIGIGESETDFFVAAAPVITDFTPKIGSVGTLVTIDGINFDGAFDVAFGVKSAAFTMVASTQIIAIVPEDAAAGPIRITTPFGTGESSVPFVIDTGFPVVNQFSPSRGAPGAIVQIEGANFVGVSEVAFDGVNADFSVTALTQLFATVPDGATTGLISVTTSVGTGLSQTEFYVPPRITSFSPMQDVEGASILIQGSNFDDVISVQINGVTAPFTSDSTQEITATVPAAAGRGTISVTTPGGIVSSAGIFTILPNVTEISPPNGPIGTSVTISGTHLKEVTEVLFNGVRAVFTVSSESEIRATVPIGASRGRVSVVTPSAIAVSQTEFIVAASADLGVSSSVSPGSIELGRSLNYHVAITNDGPSFATVIVLTNRLNSNSRYVSAFVSQGIINQTGNTLRVELGSLAPGASASLDFVVTPTITGTVTNTVQVAGNEIDPDLENNVSESLAAVVETVSNLRIRRLDTGEVVISWPAEPAEIVLQMTDTLGNGDWSTVADSTTNTDEMNEITIPAPFGRSFYRLMKP